VGPIDPSGLTAGTFVRRTIARSVTLILRHDPGARRGEPEDVHKLRVATRRLRSDLRTFTSLVDAGGLPSELAWLGDQVGAVRDVDVLLERLEPVVAALSPTSTDAVTGAALLDHFRAGRSEARQALLHTLLDDRYTALLHDAVGMAEAPRLRPEAEQPAGDAVLPLVAAAWLRLDRAVDDLPADPADSDLHRVRIRAKRCRYASEAIAAELVPEAKPFASAVADLQGVLGDHQDAVAAEAALRAAAAELPHLAPVAWQLIDGEQAERARLRAAWPAVWAAASADDLRTWMPA
jgi:CHAD domain-containing protein